MRWECPPACGKGEQWNCLRAGVLMVGFAIPITTTENYSAPLCFYRKLLQAGQPCGDQPSDLMR
jgi:hypothetical protein